MSEPQQSPADPTAVILARMEVKLDNALDQQARQGTTIDRHDVRITKLENRTTALETRAEGEDNHQRRTSNGKQLAWQAAAAIAAIAAVVLAVLLAVRGH